MSSAYAYCIAAWVDVCTLVAWVVVPAAVYLCLCMYVLTDATIVPTHIHCASIYLLQCTVQSSYRAPDKMSCGPLLSLSLSLSLSTLSTQNSDVSGSALR